MRNFILIILIFVLGCAVGVTGSLRLQDRELLIHPDRPGLGYPHKVTKCKGKFIFKKCETSYVVDFYDLTKKSTRDKLITAGFTCKSKMRFKY